MIRRASVNPVLLLLSVVASPLAAQDHLARQGVRRLHDSLATVSDSSSLRALEAHMIDSARKDRSDALLHVRLGYVGLRLAELTGGAGHFRDAEGEFAWATELQPTWPVAWYALGKAELLEADVGPAVIRGIFASIGRDLFTAPARDYAHSGEVDSTFTEGLVEPADEALSRGINSHLTTALAALRHVADLPVGRTLPVLIARGRIEREVGDADSAIAAFNRAVALNPTSGVALAELGRTRLMAGRRSGVDAWYRGLQYADSDALLVYRTDLALVMSDSMLAVFDATPASQRAAVLRHFWNSRDVDGLADGSDRLREHYRRIDVAHRNYALIPHGKRYDSLIVYVPGVSLFDDRGRILVRHGDPDERTSLTLTALPPNETWLYHRAGGDMVFNFAQPDSARGFRLYESLLDIAGLGTAAQATGRGDVRAQLDSGKALETYGAGWIAQGARELLYSRQRISSTYRDMLQGGPATAATMQAAERVAGRETNARALQTDSWRFGYELPMTASVDAVAVGSRDGATAVQLSFAIPGSSLYLAAGSARAVYPIRMRAVFRDKSGEIVASVDTLRQFVSDGPIPDQGELLSRLPVEIPPGDYTVRVAVESESRGVVTVPQQVHVAAMSNDHLALSDLAMGAKSVPLPWRVGPADTAWLNPTHRYRSSEPIELLFEVGGIPADANYHGELAVLRPGRSNPLLQVGFNRVSRGTPDRVRQQLNVSQYAAGTYILQVTVTTPSGGKASRQREFTIVR